MLSLDEAIRARHSVRNFSDKRVDDTSLRLILDAGRLAPSAKNRQPWRFLIASSVQKEAVASMMESSTNTGRAQIGTVYTSAKIVRRAPVLIIVFLQGDAFSHTSDLISLGACLENMSLKATDLGLGSLIVCDSQCCRDELSAMFGGRGTVEALFLVGHEGEELPRASKLPLEAISDGLQFSDCEEIIDDLPEADIVKEPFLFISYSHLDAATVITDIRELKKHGVRLWYDRSILYGEPWDEKALNIMRQDNCAGVLVYISENSVRSSAVAKELNCAKERFIERKTCILPIHIGDLPLSSYLGANAQCDRIFSYVFSEQDKYISRSRTSNITDAVLTVVAEAVRLGAAAESGVYDELQYERTADGIRITAYIGSSAKVCIPFRIAGLPVIALGNNLFHANNSVREIVLPDTIVHIGDGAFLGMTSLKKVILPNNLLYLGVAVFRGCTSLEHIRLPNTLKKLEEALFRECSSLQECYVPESVVEFGEAVFRDCTSLKFVDMPTVLKMTEGAFYGCRSLEQINTSPFLRGAEETSFITCPLLNGDISGMHIYNGKAEGYISPKE